MSVNGNTLTPVGKEHSGPIIDLLMAYEGGTLGVYGILQLFSALIVSGQAWTFQGHYGRTAQRFIDNGIINLKGIVDMDKIDIILDNQYVPEEHLGSNQGEVSNG